MKYEFRDVRTGEPVVIDMPVAKAVPIGSVVRQRGRDLVRVASQVNRGAVRVAPSRITSVQLPKGAKGAPYYDEKGRPCFDSERQIKDFIARANDKTPGGDKAIWDR